MTALQRAVELDPAQPDAHFRLVRLYQAMGNTPPARRNSPKFANFTKKKMRT